MRKEEFINSITRSFNNVGFRLKKHSPEILVVAGIVGAVATTVMACKATLKVNEVLEETKENVDKIHERADQHPDVYPAEDAKKDLCIVYAKTGLNFVKLYGPSVLLGAASITSILAGYNILHKRNVAIAAAYTAVFNDFKGYRGRVIERFGQELDRELKYNIRSKEVEERVVDDKGGEKIVKKTVTTVNPEHNEFTRCFDETCTAWTKNAEDNKYFLMCQQNYANELLQRRGHLFLNEVFDMLGMQRNKAGAVTGWIADGDGDGFVDFGIFDINCEAARNFVNELERSVWLNFNVDGYILDKI